MDEVALQRKVSELAAELGVTGVSVGVYIDGKEHYAFAGVTSVENPLPVDEETLFQFGSTGKTYTATAMMRLVERGEVDLDAPVRKYLPNLKLKDEETAERVTILQLFNHTAGWSGDLMTDTGEGDDALAKYVDLMADIDQVTPLGAAVSYNNASLSLAGHVIATITGKTYEKALRELILDPIGMHNTFFFPNEVMTRRFAVGHNKQPDGTMKIARPWAMSRGGMPAGGMSANSKDQILWARFHLGDGTAPDGTRVLSKELLDLMKQPTVETPGSALGDYIGISWMLRDVEGVRLVGHGGDTIGQHSEFITVPERDFAISSMTNSSTGPELNERLTRWALEAYLGVVETDAEPILLGDDVLAPYTGRFETIAASIDITARQGLLVAQIEIKPETRKEMSEAGEDIPEPDPFVLGLIEAGSDRYVVAEGEAKGMKGYFSRNDQGEVDAVHVGGRLATRVKKPART
ncbi:MAG TPA: serine hydrolase domain-containing protein [Acidimicrobiales bacterium]|nr:serine hydrolase domain-containing protein [Acidimicrobiales bacterium]